MTRGDECVIPRGVSEGNNFVPGPAIPCTAMKFFPELGFVIIAGMLRFTAQLSTLQFCVGVPATLTLCASERPSTLVPPPTKHTTWRGTHRMSYVMRAACSCLKFECYMLHVSVSVIIISYQ